MTSPLLMAVHLVNVTVVPLLLVGVIRKTKARMQNRVGAPVLQPFYDTAKLFRKGETISETASWVFVWAPRVCLAIALLAALLVPWSGAPAMVDGQWLMANGDSLSSTINRGPHARHWSEGVGQPSTINHRPTALPGDRGWSGATDFLLVLYLLGLGKFLSMLAAMDTGSAFGGLGASREAAISLLVEPTLVLGLGALALGAGSTDLATIYASPASSLVAALVGAALVVAALAELSRMPVDDPTTHLELTMVHEALILENSGRNLALVELAVALRTCLFLGLAAQTLLRVWPLYGDLLPLTRYGIGLLALFGAGAAVAVAEGVLVKLNWRRVPNFVAFGMALSLLAALAAAARG